MGYWNPNRISHQELCEFKSKLNRFFEMLRAKKLIARQNFSCCSGCASYELGAKLRESQTKKTPKVGMAFYHRQDTADLDYGKVYIAYCGLDVREEEDQTIGQLVADTAKEVGLAAVWNGSSSERVQILAPCLASALP